MVILLEFIFRHSIILIFMSSICSWLALIISTHQSYLQAFLSVTRVIKVSLWLIILLHFMPELFGILDFLLLCFKSAINLEQFLNLHKICFSSIQSLHYQIHLQRLMNFHFFYSPHWSITLHYLSYQCSLTCSHVQAICLVDYIMLLWLNFFHLTNDYGNIDQVFFCIRIFGQAPNLCIFLICNLKD